MAALLTVLIIARGRLARRPGHALREAADARGHHAARGDRELDEDATSFTCEGTSIPGATITVEMAGGNRQTTADSDRAPGSMTVDVRRGRNEFKIDATDPETGKHAETASTVVITVPFREIEAPSLTVNQPAEGTTFENGAIPVQGTAANATEVTITATYEGPATGAPAASAAPSKAPSSPPSPAPITVPVADDGTWNTGASPLQLTTGRWSITVTATNAPGQVRVPDAARGRRLQGRQPRRRDQGRVGLDQGLGRRQARPTPSVGPATTYTSGKVLTFTGQTSIEVRTGSSGATLFTLNGQSLGRARASAASPRRGCSSRPGRRPRRSAQ